MWISEHVDGLMVIAPPGVHEQWITEEFPTTTDVKIKGAAYPEMPDLNRSEIMPRVFTIYPQAFRRNTKKSNQIFNLCKKFLASGRIGLIIDESQMIANAKAKQRRRINALKRLAAYRRIASGFPAPKGLIQYYPQFSFLNTKILDCSTKGQFEDRYVVKGGFMGRQIVDYRNVDDFNRRVAPYTYTVELDKCRPLPGVDWKGMPGRTWETIDVPLTSEQRKLVEQVKKEFRAIIGEETILMPMALQRLIRIQQIANGFLPQLDVKGKKIGLIRIPERRTEVLENLMERTRGKIIIWCRFNYTIDRLAKHFGAQAVRYRGGMDREERRENKLRFQRDPNCLWIFASAKAAGAGFNGLQVSRHSLYWDNTFDAQDRRQTERRTWRLGQSRNCWYGDLIAEGTYDAHIRNVLMNRQNVSAGILSDIAAWRADRPTRRNG